MKLLIVDDEKALRENLSASLQSALPEFSFQISQAQNGREAIEFVKRETFDLVIMDVRMPEVDGLTALKSIKEIEPQTFVVIMTAHSNLHDAVEAIKQGAYDYLEKPVDLNRLCEIVKKSETARAMISNLALSLPIFDDDVDTEFVGSSKKMREIFDLIYKLCKVDTTVLIRGENGTGKELVARAIHFNSHRKDHPFVAINCGAIPENLIESELFGHEKGSFTGATERKIGKFQLANNGTIFLDEIAELRPELQVKLLRVLQERTFVPIGSAREVKTTARIIAATNQNLEKQIEDHRFREDLFYRLNVMPIFLPPLRERREDIPQLVDHFMKNFEKQHGRKLTGIRPDALEILQNYPWPGNIRELENTIERAFIVETSETITKTSLPDNIQKAGSSPMPSDLKASYSGPLNYETFKEEMEKDFIIQALKVNKGRINKTVAYANIPKNTLLRKIKKYGINVKDYSEKD
ncbi:MAG: sigma-54-dependent Fis family transcriptional regulator [Bdellovibrionales bacterium]|nr:sigma-54-dependent Fis family transcriptional regulator [Bdellovibrionales bacterium]